MTVTRTFKISGLLSVVGVVLIILGNALDTDGLLVPGIILTSFCSPVFCVSLVRHLLRGLLWRVGSRLFVSYVLLGFVPLPFLLLLVFVQAAMVGGQLATNRVQEALKDRSTKLTWRAAWLAERFAATKTPAERQQVLAAAALVTPVFPDLSYALVPESGAIERGGPETFPIPEEELPDEGTNAYVEKRLLMVAEAPFRRGDRLILAAPMKSLSAPFLAETGIAFEPYLATPEEGDDEDKSRDTPPPPGEPDPAARDTETGEPRPEPAPTAVPEETPAPRKWKGGVTVDTGRERFRVETDPTTSETAAAAETAANAAAAAAKSSGAAPARKEPFSILRNRWVNWGGRLAEPPLDLDTGKRSEKKRVLLWTRSSLAREFHEFYGRTRLDTGNEREGAGEGKSDDNIAYRILMVLGTFVGVIYLVAATLAALLVSRIARATGRLSKGFAEIEKGNFSHRASFRGRDQLAELIGSFNRMSAHLAESVTEKAKTEALAHELTLARTLQRRLLPTGFIFPGVEIAVDFRPASVIGGDFYHFVAVGPSDLVVVVADVSGHGLPTGIVMASAKASLSAFLATGAEPSAIFTSLDREVRETTDARTFVTMGHSRFRLATGTMELTNAGHLYPYRVTSEGAVSSVANPSRPLGPTLPTKFVTVSAPIAKGDLWVFLSDGIVEATGTDDTPFGFDRLESVLASCAGRTAAQTKETLLAAWRTHTGSDEPEDDRTLIVVRLEK